MAQFICLGLTLLTTIFSYGMINKYNEHEPRISNVAIKALEKHFWYLTEECAVFSLFSNNLLGSERQDIARRLNRTASAKII